MEALGHAVDKLIEIDLEINEIVKTWHERTWYDDGRKFWLDCSRVKCATNTNSIFLQHKICSYTTVVSDLEKLKIKTLCPVSIYRGYK